MKTTALILASAFCASAIAVETANPLIAKQGESDASKPSVLQRVGGFVIDYTAARGKYAFVNCQKKIDVKIVNGLAVRMKEDYCWNFDSVASDAQVTTIAQAIDEKNKIEALAATFFVDSPELPVLSVAPESNLAVVNVRKLSEGNPKPILLENRIVRETIRAFAFSLGAGYTTFEAGVMQPIATVADLDRFPANFMPPDVANAALQNGAKIGFKPYRRTTYKRACKEGWAPAPTNEFQRAVWEKIKAEKSEKPTNPIKVNYDPKTAPKVEQ